MAPGLAAARREAAAVMARLVAPMMPHLAEEMWQALGHAELIADTAWPTADPELARDEQVTIAVQVNGKLRGTLDLPRDAAAREVEEAALALPQVMKFLEGRVPKKVVVVPNRIVSVVA
jgi:leucyl-tRNA synthetase